jgi:resuscitation-promoting factor RpfB
VIRRARLRASLFLAIAALAVSLGAGSLVTSPSAALAGVTVSHLVTLDANGVTSVVRTSLPTIAALLAERRIAVRAGDYLEPAPDVPISDGLTITFRSLSPVTIVVARQARHVMSSASSIADLLDEQQIALGVDDIVKPSLDAPVPRDGVVRVIRVREWQKRIATRVLRATLYRLDMRHPLGGARVAQQGRDGVRITVVSLTQHDGGRVVRRVISYLARAPRERIIDAGLGPSLLARSKVRMVATAYTPHCYGCSGRTALGLRAGPGIVAVDPRVIPLGSRLYIPGYGFALAGDTGGDIRGNRVDLGFASYDAAMRFGRREVTVYTLK